MIVAPSAGASRDCAIVISHNHDTGASVGASRDYAIVISCNPDSGASTRASRDHAIVISRNPDNDTSVRVSRDYAIVISRSPDNGAQAGGVPRRRKAATNDDKTDNAQHLPVHLLLQWKRTLLGKGGRHHLIYVG